MSQNQPPTMIQHQPESSVLQTYDFYSSLTNAPTLVGSKKRFQINGRWCWLLWNFNTYDMLLLFHIIPIIPIYVLQTTIVIHCTSLYYRFFDRISKRFLLFHGPRLPRRPNITQTFRTIPTPTPLTAPTHLRPAWSCLVLWEYTSWISLNIVNI